MKRTVASLAIGLLVTGCASAPVHTPPPVSIYAPATWAAAAADSAPSPDWWRDLGDDRLNGVIEEALASNYDIMAASARLEQAAATARVARADLLPNLSAGFAASRSRNNIFGIPIPGTDVITTRQSTFGVSLDAAWEIDLWGRARKGHSAALATAQASAADLAGVRLSIAGQTAKAWFALVESAQQMQLAQETVESYERSVEQVRRRYREGVTTSLDLRLALTSLANAKSSLALRRQQLDAAKRQLEILLGRYPGARIESHTSLPKLSGGVPTGLPSELLIRRPDLVGAERRYAAATARASQARRAFFPSISLTGSAGTSSTDLQDLTNLDFGVWSIAARLTQPIFQGGRLRANLAASNAAADQSLVAYVQSLLRAFGEVELALVAERTLDERVINLADAAEQSDAARDLARRQYDAGLVDYITVLETQRQSLAAQSQLLTARRQRLDARVNLYLALGGGFDMDGDWTTFLEPAINTNGGSR